MAGDIELAEERGEQRARIEALSGEMKTFRQELSEMRKDVSDIKQMIATNKGGIKMLLSVGGIAAGLGATIAEIVRYVHK